MSEIAFLLVGFAGGVIATVAVPALYKWAAAALAKAKATKKNEE
jgi:hypothetical protein